MKILIEEVKGSYQVQFEGNKIIFETMKDAQEFVILILQRVGKLGE